MKQTLFDTSKITVHCDGGSRGNPGPAAVGVVIEYGGMKKKYCETIGYTTNNVAEYKAVIFALKKVKQLVGKAKTKAAEINFYMDSELVVKQLNAEYKIEEPNLQPLFMEVWNLKFDFGTLRFNYVPREKNREADALANKAMDAEDRPRNI